MKNSKAQSLWLNIALVSVALAIGLHTYLTFHYYDIKFGLSSAESVCNVSQAFNCDAVSASDFSSFLGIPMALWGAVTNAILFLLLLFLRLNLVQDRAKLARYSLWLSGFIALMSVVMGIISLSFVAAFCLFCIGTYVLSFLAFAGTWQAQEGRFAPHIKEDLSDLTSRCRWVGGFLIAIPALSFLFHNMIQDSKGIGQIESVVQDSLIVWHNGKVQNFNTEGSLIKGAENPKMTIVEFADFRCPHCKHASPTLKAFVAAHKDVQLIFKPFPLDGSCNPSPNMAGGGDGVSCRLAYATHCGEELAQKGWPVHDYIFERQSQWAGLVNTEKQLEEMATSLQINWEELKACMDKAETKEAIAASAQQGLDAKISGTPTVFVNGKKLPAGQTLPVLREVYQTL